MPVMIGNKKGEFESKFCLNYKLENMQNLSKLTKLNFKAQADNVYEKCFMAKGRYFKAQNLDKVNYNFQNPIKTSIYTYESKKDVLGLLAVTPITLAIDAVFMPVFILSGIEEIIR